jgi:flagellum-specific peptidoglycan hydrolase FlgJ
LLKENNLRYQEGFKDTKSFSLKRMIMQFEPSKRIKVSEKKVRRATVLPDTAPIKKRIVSAMKEPISLSILLTRIWPGLQRLIVALKFKLHRVLPIPQRVPWAKLAIAAVVLFVILKRDLQFQVNLQSPGAAISDDQRSQDGDAQLAAASSLTSTPAPKKPKVSPFADLPGDDKDTRTVKAYIRRFKEVAQKESTKFGIPASVKMGQALIESNAGNSRLATQNNNHFGIKCFSKSCKKGHCSNFSDDHHKDFFRNYESAWESWRSHSNMLVNGRYKKLLEHGNDYKAWAKGLKELGYATDKRYTEKLIKKIEQYQLYTLDQ